MEKAYKYFLLALILLISINGISASDLNETADEINNNVYSEEIGTLLEADDIEMYYKDGSKYEVYLYDSNNTPIANQNISITVSGVEYNRSTNINGMASLNLNLDSGEYNITAVFKGNDLYSASNTIENKLTILSTISGNNLVKMFQNGSQYYAEFLNSDGSFLINSNINFNINGVLYTRSTDSKGVASLNINLDPGIYIITAINKNGDRDSNLITVLSTINGSNLNKMFQNDSQYYAEFLDYDSSPLANTDVRFNINGVIYTRTTDSKGVARLNINLDPNTYIITSFNTVTGEESSNLITVFSNLIENSNIIKYYKNGTQYTIKVLDSEGNLAIGENVTFNINGIFYNRTANNEGIASLSINLNPNTYIITAQYNGLSVSNIIEVLPVLFGKDLSNIFNDGNYLQVTLVDGQGNKLNDETITFNVNGELFTRRTNEEGIATLDITLNSGEYSVSYYVAGNDSVNLASNHISVKNSIELTLHNWDTGGDLSKNSLIYNNVPNSDLLKEIVSLAKSGTPMVTVKGGSGDAVFMLSGIHGNELSSQVAIMQLINYLESNPVSGTVYIIPFIAPAMTSSNERYYNGVNLNGVANNPGTVSNNVINLAIEYGVSALGDFHCTRPGGDPGKNVAMGTYSPTVESANMAKGIASLTGHDYLIYSAVGVKYSDAVEDVANLNGIPAVTCEVVTAHGTIASGSVENSYSQMIAFLKYNGLI
ncbi:hypothetical protein [Methanobrevibacter sp. DSM 116169]|uniref:hypothetical protein n=1 Tax=Methanobrevibacter sp. DSM 116169 TaxID=3242727 RepID=UPI0038FD2BEB